MTPPVNNYFFDTICHLRSYEEIVIYNRFTPITVADERPVADFLLKEYEKECLEFPAAPPGFEQEAAIWAAKTLYITAQLLLFREKEEEEIARLLPAYPGTVSPGAMLSADLCLRFLPDILEKAREISPDDILISLLENHLQQWHFSGVGCAPDNASLDWDPIAENDCLKKLYIDRIIQRRVLPLTEIPLLRSGVMAAMGGLVTHFWKELQS